MLTRRQFVSRSLALMTSAVTASAWGAAADSVLALGNMNHLANNKWSMAFDGADGDFPPLQMTTSGHWPSDLSGFLYRNGPSKMTRGGARYTHWFDGDGMVQQFEISAAKVSHKGKFVQTKKYKAEEKAGRFKYRTAGTLIPKALPIRNNDDMNVANTSIIPWRGELLALWEAGSPYRIEPTSLETIGVKSFGDKFKQLPFSAHPLPDGEGGMWNFGSWFVGGDNSLLLYQVSKADELIRMEVITLPQASYMHGFAQSQNKLIFYVSSCVYEEGQTYIDAFKWRPEIGSKLLIIDKANFALQQWVDLPAGFAFHFGQAVETGNQLDVQLSLYSNADILLKGMVQLLSGKVRDATTHAELVTISVALESAEILAQQVKNRAIKQVNAPSKQAKIHRSGVEMEFPQFDARIEAELQPVFGVGTSQSSGSGLSDTLYCVKSFGAKSYYLGENKIIEEPLYIPKNDKVGEGYLLMTWLDVESKQTGLSLFESADIEKGPIAEAKMDRVLPLGFHGCFV